MTIPADSERSLTKSVYTKQHFDDLLSFKRVQSHDALRCYVKTSKLILGQNVINSKQCDFSQANQLQIIAGIPKLNISKHFNLICFYIYFIITIIELPFFYFSKQYY